MFVVIFYFLMQGLYPLISLTPHKTNSSSSCIDNIFTNAIEKCCLSGIIDDIGLHHSPIFSIFNLSLSGTSGKQTLQIQEYNYSAKNIEALQQELNAELIEVYKSLDFEGFFQLFKDGIDHCCKLAKPKYSKRNPINNLWKQMVSLMPLNIKMIFILIGSEQNLVTATLAIETFMKNLANTAIVSRKLQKIKSQYTIKTKFPNVVVILRRTGRSLINSEAKVKSP